MPKTFPFDPAGQAYQSTRIAHWDLVACKRDTWQGWGSAYHRRLREIYSFLVSPGLRVLEIGCATGSILAAVRPAHGVGVDFSPEMLNRAHTAHPEYELIRADAHDLSSVEGPFDTIILSDLVNDLWDVQRVFEEIRRLSIPSTRVILNFHSGLWQLPLADRAVAEHCDALLLPQNWLTPVDARSMLYLAGFECIRAWHEILWPFPFGGFANKFLVRLWPFHELAITNFVIARPIAESAPDQPVVSVIIPARNEFGQYQSHFRAYT